MLALFSTTSRPWWVSVPVSITIGALFAWWQVDTERRLLKKQREERERDA
jgi:hypothetical protein